MANWLHPFFGGDFYLATNSFGDDQPLGVCDWGILFLRHGLICLMLKKLHCWWLTSNKLPSIYPLILKALLDAQNWKPYKVVRHKYLSWSMSITDKNKVYSWLCIPTYNLGLPFFADEHPQQSHVLEVQQKIPWALIHGHFIHKVGGMSAFAGFAQRRAQVNMTWGVKQLNQLWVNFEREISRWFTRNRSWFGSPQLRQVWPLTPEPKTSARLW